MRGFPRFPLMAFAMLLVATLLPLGQGAAAPATRDTIRLAIRTTVVGLDPKFETASTVGNTNANVLESLFELDFDGATIKPVLALDAKPETATSWVIRLRPNVKFHDGTPFNAAAAKFSLERMADTDSAHRGNFSWIERIEAVNDTTIRIRTKFPYAAIMSALSFYQPYIVSPTAVQQAGAQFGQKPVGTGPYMYESHVPRQKSVMVRNENYWGPKPPIRRAEWLQVIEENSRLAGMLSGELDILTVIEPSIMIALGREPRFAVLRGPDDLVDRVGFNTKKRPFDDVRVRRAVVHGINRVQMLATIFGGVGVVFDPPFSPGSAGYDPATMARLTYPYDQARARQLLTEAGFPNGFRTSFTIINRPDHRQIGEVIQSHLRQVGIDLQLRAFDFATVSQSTRQGEHDMYIIGTYGVGDPERVLVEYESANIGVNNRNYWSDPEVDKLIADQRKEMDPQKRMALVRRAAAKIREALPDFALRWRRAVLGVNKKVKGFRVHPMKWSLQNVTVEP